MAKKVIQRNLPLKQHYSLMGVLYKGDDYMSCQNCGRPINNVAHIKGDDDAVHYYIGMDCLDTLLENNSLLNDQDYFKYQYSDKPAIAKAKALRAKILKQKKLEPSYQAVLYKATDGKRFGFSYSKMDTNNPERKWRTPMGWDYTFGITYLDLTLKYVEGLYDLKENE